MKRACAPAWVRTDGQYTPMQHVPFGDKRLSESDLQQLLHACPDTLPIEEIDASFGPVVSLGREINRIDNLLISAEGRITIVETKLWRNPESTRKVVAQILDYATAMTAWSYEDFEAQCRRAESPAPLGKKSLFEFVSDAFPESDLDEAMFIDQVQRTLRTGRFMLLIVGDGIRENLEQILEPLHRLPQHLFTFALVQMRFFDHPTGDGFLVVPQVIANTVEVVRSVVRVVTTGSAKVTVDVEEKPENTSGGRRPTLSEDEFFDAIRDPDVKSLYAELVDFARREGCVLSLGSSSISVKIPNPQGGPRHFTIFLMNTNSRISTGWLHGQLEAESIPGQIAVDYVNELHGQFGGREGKGPADLDIPATEVFGREEVFQDIVRKAMRNIHGSP